MHSKIKMFFCPFSKAIATTAHKLKPFNVSIHISQKRLLLSGIDSNILCQGSKLFLPIFQIEMIKTIPFWDGDSVASLDA